MEDHRDLVDVIMDHSDAVLIVQQVQQKMKEEQRRETLRQLLQ